MAGRPPAACSCLQASLLKLPQLASTAAPSPAHRLLCKLRLAQLITAGPPHRLLCRLRRTNFGAPRKDRTGALGAVAPSAADHSAQPQAGGLHTAAASWAAQGGSVDDVAQELVEKGG